MVGTSRFFFSIKYLTIILTWTGLVVDQEGPWPRKMIYIALWRGVFLRSPQVGEPMS